MQTRPFAAVLIAALALFAAGCQTGAQSKATPNATVSKAEQEMMEDLAHANIAEIQTGKLALSRSNNPSVRQFAQRMIDDHTTMTQDLQKLAQAKGIQLPTETDVQHKALAGALKGLSALSGNAFDRQYIAQVGVADHKRTHELLEKVERTATDPEFRALAKKAKPVVHEHLVLAQQLADANK